MKTTLSCFLLLCPIALCFANDQITNTPTVPVFSGTSRFSSLSQFEQSLRNFEPSQVKNKWGNLFSAAEVGQPDDPETGTVVFAPHIADVKLIWNNDDTAVFFVTADPQTNVARSEVGVVVLLVKQQNQWSISDYLKYTGIGHYGGVNCELASDAGSGRKITDIHDVYLTVEITEGGRGMSHKEYQTLKLEGGRILKYIP